MSSPPPHPAEHRYGFVVVRPDLGSGRAPEGWRTEEMGGWTLISHPDLPVAKAPWGWVLGWPMGTRRTAVGDLDDLEQVVEGAGRFLTIEVGDAASDCWAMPDSGGSLSAFYPTAGGCVASNPELAELVNPGCTNPRNAEEEGALRAAHRESGTWFPGGLCPEFENWRVLLPNHRLAVESGTIERCWPGGDFATAVDGGVSFAQEIGDKLSDHLAAWSEEARLEVRLSAGRDSRMVLASCRHIIDRCTFSVDEPPPDHHAPEVEISEVLAEVLGLDHRSRGEPLRGHVLVHGFAGEIGRGHYWPEGGGEITLPDDPAEAAKVLRRTLRMPEESAGIVEPELARWREGLAGLPAPLIFDLLYLEQRMATTMGPLLYRFDDVREAPSVIAMNSRAIYAAMMAAPVAYRQQWKLGDDLCSHIWPAVHLVPLNKTYFTGREKLAQLLRLAIAPFLGASYQSALGCSRLWKMFFARPPAS